MWRERVFGSAGGGGGRGEEKKGWPRAAPPKEYTGSRVWRRGALPRALETEERAVVLVVGSPDGESTIRANK